MYATQMIFNQEGVMEFLILLVMLMLLDLAVMRWGAISLDGIDSPEWERRQRWYAFH
jgi:hypothetical protein